jgi:Kelch motif
LILAGLLAAACMPGGPTAAKATPSPPIATATPSPSPTPTPTPIPQQAEAPLPLPRQEVAEGVQPGNPDSLWVVGGFDPQRRSSATVQLLIKSWAPGPAYPFPVDHGAAVTAERRLYVAGGYSNGVARADLYRINSSLNSWEKLAPMHHPRGALALVAMGQTLYAIGGAARGTEVAQVEAYDTVQNVWTDVGTLPLPRDHGAAWAWQGLACLAGGRSPVTARVDCFDPIKKVWSRLPDLPFATSGAGAIAIEGQVIVAGGENAAETALVNHVFRSVGAAWSDEAMLVPRHGVQLAVFGGRVWACGGATAAGYHAATDCTSLA